MALNVEGKGLSAFPGLTNEWKEIAIKIENKQRITPEEGLKLFEEAPLSLLGVFANYIREREHGHKTYFNRNFHIEPTNVCVFSWHLAGCLVLRALHSGAPAPSRPRCRGPESGK